jgi:hypothetical protein
MRKISWMVSKYLKGSSSRRWMVGIPISSSVGPSSESRPGGGHLASGICDFPQSVCRCLLNTIKEDVTIFIIPFPIHSSWSTFLRRCIACSWKSVVNELVESQSWPVSRYSPDSREDRRRKIVRNLSIAGNPNEIRNECLPNRGCNHQIAYSRRWTYWK